MEAETSGTGGSRHQGSLCRTRAVRPSAVTSGELVFTKSYTLWTSDEPPIGGAD